MTERIKQLALLAGLEWKKQQPHYTNTDNPIDFPESANRNLEKFAQLIVQECAGVVEHAVNHREPASTYVGKIKQHFGVE